MRSLYRILTSPNHLKQRNLVYYVTEHTVSTVHSILFDLSSSQVYIALKAPTICIIVFDLISNICVYSYYVLSINTYSLIHIIVYIYRFVYLDYIERICCTTMFMYVYINNEALESKVGLYLDILFLSYYIIKALEIKSDLLS